MPATGNPIRLLQIPLYDMDLINVGTTCTGCRQSYDDTY